MSVYTLNLQNWWELLSPAWQQVIKQALDLEDCFAHSDLEYIFTITELNCHGVSDLSPLYYMPQLQVLHLGYCEVADYSPLRALPQLRQLHLTFCNTFDAGLLAGLGQLEVLDLSYPREALRNQDALAHLRQLKEIYLNGCQLQHLSPLMGLQQLRVLCVYFNALLPGELQQFRALHPHCKLMI